MILVRVINRYFNFYTNNLLSEIDIRKEICPQTYKNYIIFGE